MNNDSNQAGLIGGVEKRQIEIVPYDPRWPEIFNAHAEVVADALGSAALRIEHIGSTSVPGLAAKPIVDMLLVVGDSADEAAYLSKLEAAGYVLRGREPHFHEHRLLRTLARDIHLHVLSLGSSEIERYLLFRDRLRTNASDRQLYEGTKRALAAHSWPDMDSYAAAKTDVVERIIASARATGETSAAY